MCAPFSVEKVKGVKESILTAFEPSLIKMVVCPKNPEELEKTNLAASQYEVLQGRHLLEALKQLQSEGRLTNLKTLQKGQVTCYILSTKSADLKTYSNLRAKEIEAAWANSTDIEELLNVHLGLKSELGEVDSRAAILRYTNFIGFSSDDKAALSKLIAWPAHEFQSLVEVVSKFKSFETSDCKTNMKRIEGKLKAGNSYPMKKTLFRNSG